MIIEPKVRGFICTTAHPDGCAQNVQEQIDYIREQGVLKNGPKKVLVVGASTGYGLSSRIMAAFGASAATIGVFFEKGAEGKRTATAGWYNSVAFEEKAIAEGLYAKSFNGDAYSNEIKNQVAEAIKADLGQIDLLVYSLASPRRQHPNSGEVHKSVLKPIGEPYTNTSIDMSTDKIEEVTLPPATDDEINQTVSVMGGEDWQMWIDVLEKENLLSDNFLTVAYSYVGPEVTHKVYRHGTIGRAKEHLEATAKQIDAQLGSDSKAYVSVNKALVTQSSSAIPFIPLYYIILNKVMLEMNLDEECVEQIYRLFSGQLYSGKPIQTDDSGLIRIDEREMREDVQEQVNANWSKVSDSNLTDITDISGYHRDFLKLFGFGVNGVDYAKDTDPDRKLPSIIE